MWLVYIANIVMLLISRNALENCVFLIDLIFKLIIFDLNYIIKS